VSALHWGGQALSVVVRRLRAAVELGEFLSLLTITPPQIDTVVFRCDGQLYVAFGGGLPAIAAGDGLDWRGRPAKVVAVVNATDSLTELTQRALDAPTPSIGKGLAKVARLLHIDRALDRLGIPEWLLVMSDWGPYESATEPLADAGDDWPSGTPLA
jgi:hypothetical protein